MQQEFLSIICVRSTIWFLKSHFFSLAAAATFLNSLPLIMVISAPVSIMPEVGTPCTCTLTYCGLLPSNSVNTTVRVRKQKGSWITGSTCIRVILSWISGCYLTINTRILLATISGALSLQYLVM